MDNQRTELRTHLIYYLRVFDRQTRTLFGHVVDLSPSGMLITSNRPMSVDAQYQLELEDITRIDHLATIDMSVECRWCHEDRAGELYDSGFRFIDPSERLNSLLIHYQ